MFADADAWGGGGGGGANAGANGAPSENGDRGWGTTTASWTLDPGGSCRLRRSPVGTKEGMKFKKKTKKNTTTKTDCVKPAFRSFWFFTIYNAVPGFSI